VNSQDPYTGMVRRYIDALGKGDARALTDLFTPGGEVVSPLVGRLPAGRFFAELDQLTEASELTLVDILVGAGRPRRLAAYFRYRWTLRSGPIVDFDCCDVFEFAQVGGGEPRIELMTIIYDTAPVRELMD
jgi:hypothetical protein